MEFVVSVNSGIFLEVLREITTLSVAERELHGVLESIVVFLDLGLFGPVQLGEDFDAAHDDGKRSLNTSMNEV